MKVIHALWEKRNLGVDTIEFEMDGSENEEEIRDIIQKNEREYNVVKFPVGNVRMNFLFTELGYTYIESLIRLEHDLKHFPDAPIIKRISKELSYAPMNDDDLYELFNEIKSGMFKTDRIALDPFFSVEAANKRYINWIKDELQRGSEMFKIVYKNATVHFFGYKETADKIFFPFLGGDYKKYVNSGLGPACMMKSVEETVKRSGKRNYTFVSTNNYSSLKSNLMAGYTPAAISNVFVKHI